MDSRPRKEELADYVTSIDAVEAATGLNFFSALNDSDENTLEANSKPVCTLPWSTAITAGDTTSGESNNQYICGTKTTCGQMTTCDEATYFLNSCGMSSLDRDKDGVPCESICN